MSQGQEKFTDPETEEEYLSGSDIDEDPSEVRSASASGVALVSTVKNKGGTRPKLWLAAVDRKLDRFDRMMERVAYWPNKPPTLSQLEAARDERLKKEAARLERVARRKEEQGVSVCLCYSRTSFVA